MARPPTQRFLFPRMPPRVGRSKPEARPDPERCLLQAVLASEAARAKGGGEEKNPGAAAEVFGFQELTSRGGGGVGGGLLLLV